MVPVPNMRKLMGEYRLHFLFIQVLDHSVCRQHIPQSTHPAVSAPAAPGQSAGGRVDGLQAVVYTVKWWKLGFVTFPAQKAQPRRRIRAETPLPSA